MRAASSAADGEGRPRAVQDQPGHAAADARPVRPGRARRPRPRGGPGVISRSRHSPPPAGRPAGCRPMATSSRPSGPCGQDFALARRARPARSRAEADQAVPLEDLRRRLGMHRGEHAEVRHHEDPVHRQLRDAFRLVGVHHHQRRLLAARRVRDTPPEPTIMSSSIMSTSVCAAASLVERVADVRSCWTPVSAARQALVVDERQAQRLAADRLLDLQLLQRLRDRGRADHLVARAGSAAPRRSIVERHPALDVLDARLRQHVADGVAHPEVGGDGAVEDRRRRR